DQGRPDMGTKPRKSATPPEPPVRPNGRERPDAGASSGSRSWSCDSCGVKRSTRYRARARCRPMSSRAASASFLELGNARAELPCPIRRQRLRLLIVAASKSGQCLQSRNMSYSYRVARAKNEEEERRTIGLRCEIRESRRKARAKALSPEKRREIARQAAL